jgi:hypothetical protein
VDDAIIGGNHESDIRIMHAREKNGAVLVNIAELIKDEKGVLIRQPIRSVARLQLFNDCLRFRWNAFEVAFPIIGPGSGLRRGSWKPELLNNGVAKLGERRRRPFSATVSHSRQTALIPRQKTACKRALFGHLDGLAVN